MGRILVRLDLLSPLRGILWVPHRQAVDLGVWRVTCDRMKPIKNPEKPTKSDEKEMHLMLELRIACLNHLAWMCLTKCSP